MAIPADLRRFGSGTLALGCATCGEGAVPVVVRAVREGAADVEDRAGGLARVTLTFVPDVSVGDVLLVQAGLALHRVDGGAA